MIAGLLLLAVAGGDLARGLPARAAGWAVAAGWWILLALAALLGLGAPAWVVAALLAIALAWSLLDAASPPGGVLALAAGPVLAALVVVAAVLDAGVPGAGVVPGAGAPAWSGPLVAGLAALAPGLPPGLALTAAGVALATTRSANLVVRNALAYARRHPDAAPAESVGHEPAGRGSVEHEPAGHGHVGHGHVGHRHVGHGEGAPPLADPARRGWELRVAGRRLATIREAAARTAPASPGPLLRGGRLIGPLERVLVIALVLAAAYPALAALVAAKGIVRFPEISRDGAGAKAEEFLIGSLVSWAIAGGLAALLAAQLA